MRIIGCDLHARQQTLAILDTTTDALLVRVRGFHLPLAQAFSWVDNPAYDQESHPRR
jgi:hypothetical protein